MSTLESIDSLSLLILAAILDWLGRQACMQSPQRRVWAVRSGVVAFLILMAVSISECGLEGPDVLLSFVFRSAITALAVTGILSLGFSIFIWCSEVLFRRPVRRIQTYAAAIQKRSLQTQQQRLLEKQQRREQLEWQRTRPEREREEHHQREQNARKETEARSRDQIRFDVRLFYDRYRRELAEVFPEEKFDAYFQSFLTDATAIDVFQQRAERLKDMIRERLEISNRRKTPAFESIEDVIAHYDEKRSLILKLPVAPEVIEDFYMQLDESMERDLREFL